MSVSVTCRVVTGRRETRILGLMTTCVSPCPYVCVYGNSFVDTLVFECCLHKGFVLYVFGVSGKVVRTCVLSVSPRVGRVFVYRYVLRVCSCRSRSVCLCVGGYVSVSGYLGTCVASFLLMFTCVFSLRVRLVYVCTQFT